MPAIETADAITCVLNRMTTSVCVIQVNQQIDERHVRTRMNRSFDCCPGNE